MRPPVFSVGFDDANLAKIGKIILLWGTAEEYLGYVVANCLGIRTERGIAHIKTLPYSKKVDLLRDSFEGTGHLRHLVDEVVFARGNFRHERDTLAHGSTATNENVTTVFAVAKPKQLTVDDINRAVERANYAAVITLELNVRLITPAAWPMETPARPA